MASTSAASTPRLFGCVVTTLQGNPLWQGWLFKPNAKLQTKPLCIAVATVFQKQPQQDTSFIKTGPYAVASVRDGDYIVSVVCSSACPDTEILMKAKEIVHNVNTLLGSEQASPERPNFLPCRPFSMRPVSGLHTSRRASRAGQQAGKTQAG
jgi:hypothetical protein